MKTSNTGVLTVLSIVAGAALLASCGGGGDSDDGRQLARDIGGTWTLPCVEHDGQWRSGTLHFDERSGTVTYSRLQFETQDCSDLGQAVGEDQGKYSIGPSSGCASGSEFRCTAIDVAWDGDSPRYGVYSVDESQDPAVLLLSELPSDPAQRPVDVDPSIALPRVAFPGMVGHAILDVYLVDGSWNPTPPPPLAGYAVLPYDLNEGSGGNYVWLYYRTGRANGADGTPLGEIYTVAQYDGESPKAQGTKLPVNLNAGPRQEHELWLYKVRATDVIMRCVVVANPTEGVTKYGPPAAEGKHDVVWVEERKPDSLKTPYPSYPPDVQDLNEGEGLWTDYIYLGYCVDR